MYAVFFRSIELLKAIKLGEEKTVAANKFITKYIPENLYEENA